MGKIKGIFSEKSIKKAQKKRKEQLAKAQRESRVFTIKCNHRNADNGKSKLIAHPEKEGVHICKICGAEVTTDPEVVNAESISEAVSIIQSAISIIRHEIDLDEKFDDKLVKAALTNADLISVYEDLEKELNRDDKKDKDKKHKNNKHRGNNNKGGKKKKRVSW